MAHLRCLASAQLDVFVRWSQATSRSQLMDLSGLRWRVSSRFLHLTPGCRDISRGHLKRGMTSRMKK